MIETRLLQYFLAVAREQNITKAAKTLYITQSTLSKQMMDLENQLGKKLFVRGKRKITLTEEGFFLKNRAQEIIELLENTETALQAEEETLSGEICIGCGETVAMDATATTQYHGQGVAMAMTAKDTTNIAMLPSRLLLPPNDTYL